MLASLIIILLQLFLSVFSWCSGYHICLTHRRSPVRSRAKTDNIFAQLFLQNLCVAILHMSDEIAISNFLSLKIRTVRGITKAHHFARLVLKKLGFHSTGETAASYVKMEQKSEIIPEIGR